MVVRTVAAAPYFHRQVAPTIHLLVHHDKYKEYPFIYIKLHPRVPLAVVIDTGCGTEATAEPLGAFDCLKSYLETYELPPTGAFGWQGGPLNPGGQRKYLIITTHVHYDHIGGIEPLASTTRAKVLCSGYDRKFIDSREARRKHSLVDGTDAKMPNYEISYFLRDFESITWPIVDNASREAEKAEGRGVELDLVAIQTPGHTPDSLTIYDKEEKFLFTGDTFYARPSSISLPWDEGFRQAIIFPQEGSRKDLQDTMSKLRGFVDTIDEHSKGELVRIACAHTTCGVPAGQHLHEVEAFFGRCGAGDVPILKYTRRFETEFALWQDGGDPMFSVLAPVTFWEDLK